VSAALGQRSQLLTLRTVEQSLYVTVEAAAYSPEESLLALAGSGKEYSGCLVCSTQSL
jgi:hypothetical protein